MPKFKVHDKIKGRSWTTPYMIVKNIVDYGPDSYSNRITYYGEGFGSDGSSYGSMSCKEEDAVYVGIRTFKVYVASSWRNPYQQDVVKFLRSRGHEVYDFKNPKEGDTGFSWAEIDENWLEWNQFDYKKALSHPLAQKGFENDFNAMKWADRFVMVTPCGRSASLEAGWAIGKGIPTITFMAQPQEPELMLLLAGEGGNIRFSIQETEKALYEYP